MAFATEQVIDIIQELYKRRTTWHKAEKTLTLQGKAACRRLCDGDKDAADALYSEIIRLSGDDLDAIISRQVGDNRPEIIMAVTEVHPLLTARAIIEHYREEVEKELARMAKQLPIADWLDTVDGMSYLSLAALVGAAGDLHRYPTVQGLWKRMGLAVMPNGRQRQMRDAQLALEHGYSPVRRSIMWNIGTSILRAQSERKLKDEEGEVIGVKKPAGRWRQVYDMRKEYELGLNETGGYAEAAAQRLKEAKFDPKTSAYKAYNEGKLPPLHLHARAQRYMEKMLLKELWNKWRQVMPKPLFVEEAEAAREAERAAAEVAEAVA